MIISNINVKVAGHYPPQYKTQKKEENMIIGIENLKEKMKDSEDESD